MLIYSMSVSVDGFIADRDGAFGWGVPSDEQFRFHLEQVPSEPTAIPTPRNRRRPGMRSRPAEERGCQSGRHQRPGDQNQAAFAHCRELFRTPARRPVTPVRRRQPRRGCDNPRQPDVDVDPAHAATARQRAPQRSADSGQVGIRHWGGHHARGAPTGVLDPSRTQGGREIEACGARPRRGWQSPNAGSRLGARSAGTQRVRRARAQRPRHR
jgi:hypothetical protein